jgi:endonuclease/exonuclease/phosphatase family metal-dependent hydrolase
LSVNIWDLPIPLPGFQRQLRRERLIAQLPAAGADLVLIQEAFRPPFKRRLAAALGSHQADHYLAARRWRFGLPTDGSGGLLTLSRFPVARSRYAPSERWLGMKLDERIGMKGCLWTEIEVGGQQVLIGNVHLYAGPGVANARVRARQIRDLLRQLAAMPRLPTILAGDFNMAIEHEVTNDGPSGFDLMQEAGFSEIASGSSAGIATMAHRLNPYAAYFPTTLPDRRLTHVFYRGERLRVTEPPSLVLDRPPVSDHYGLMTSFEL